MSDCPFGRHREVLLRCHQSKARNQSLAISCGDQIDLVETPLFSDRG